MFRAHVERCHVRGGTGAVGLRAGRSIEQDYERGGS